MHNGLKELRASILDPVIIDECSCARVCVVCVFVCVCLCVCACVCMHIEASRLALLRASEAAHALSAEFSRLGVQSPRLCRESWRESTCDEG